MVHIKNSGSAGKPGRTIIHHGRRRSEPVPGSQIDLMVTEILSESLIPRSAYSLTDRLRELGRHVPPMSVYRCLDRLVGTGRVERVQTLSAYRVRDKPGGALLICIGCGETVSVLATGHQVEVDRAAEANGFVKFSIATEVVGRCARCRSDHAAFARASG